MNNLLSTIRVLHFTFPFRLPAKKELSIETILFQCWGEE